MLDARRMEVYCAVYDSELNEVEPTSAKIIEKNSFEKILENKCRPSINFKKLEIFAPKL